MFQIASQLASYAYDTFASPWTVEIVLQDAHQRGMVKVDYDGLERGCCVFSGTEELQGAVTIEVKDGRILDHEGISLELLGRLEMRENPDFAALDVNTFLRLTKDLAPTGQLGAGKHELPFTFENLNLEKESYYGTHAFVRYFLRVTVSRGFTGTIIEEQDVIIQVPSSSFPEEPADNPPIQMEVGVQDCLHIQFVYANSHYMLDSILTGCVAFRIVRLNIVSMEMSLVRVETVSAANPADGKTNFVTTVGKMEFMDGMPARAEQVPIRWPLAGIPLHVTAAHPRLAVKHMLKLALVDEHGRQFFKQTEIVFHRKNIAAPQLTWALSEGSNLNWKDFAARKQKEEAPGLFG